MKKTLFIIGSILVIGAIALAGFWFSVETDTPATQENGIEQRTFAPFDFIEDFFAEDATSTMPVEEIPFSETAPRSVYDLLAAGPYAVTDAFVAGATLVPHALGTTTPDERLRYVERETGHVYDLSLASGKTERLSNTTVPRVQETLWGDDGELLVMRYLDTDGETVQTFAGHFEQEDDGTGRLVGDFLPQNIDTIATHPTEPRVFYLLETDAGVVGRIFDAATGQTTSLFSSPLTEWTALWESPSRIFLHTKPSHAALGFGYALNPSSGATTRVLGNTLALTALPGSGNTMLIGSVQSGIVALSRYDISTDSGSSLSLSTLPEKCSWLDATRALCAVPATLPARLPDAWYEGSIFFNDSVWVLNTETNITDYRFDAEYFGAPFDATNLLVSSDESVLAFINKRDARLWVASLSSSDNAGALRDAPFPSF